MPRGPLSPAGPEVGAEVPWRPNLGRPFRATELQVTSHSRADVRAIAAMRKRKTDQR